MHRYAESLQSDVRCALRQQPPQVIAMKCSIADKGSSILRHLSRLGQLVACLQMHCQSNKPLLQVYTPVMFESILFEPDSNGQTLKFTQTELDFIEKGESYSWPIDEMMNAIIIFANNHRSTAWFTFRDALEQNKRPLQWIDWATSLFQSQITPVIVIDLI